MVEVISTTNSNSLPNSLTEHLKVEFELDFIGTQNALTVNYFAQHQQKYFGSAWLFSIL